MGLGLLLLPLLAIYFFSAVPPEEPHPLLNQTAPPVHFVYSHKIKSRPHALADFKGKTVLLSFWASWCRPCLEELPSLKALEDKLNSRPFVLIAMNIDLGDPTLLSSVSDLPRLVAFPVSEKEMEPYEINYLPLTVLIDSQGTVRKIYVGPRNWVSASTLREIESFL